MKTKLFITLAFFFITNTIFAKGISGIYETKYGKMTLRQEQESNKVIGTYSHDNGRIEATLEGTTLTGKWSEDGEEGKMIFNFTSDFSSFKGKWGNNDEIPAAEWNGTQIEAFDIEVGDASENAEQIIGIYDTRYGQMNITKEEEKIIGRYSHDNGRIEGTLEGTTLTGKWSEDGEEGKFVFVFTSDFSSFKGKWGNNDEIPAAEWNGKKRKKQD